MGYVHESLQSWPERKIFGQTVLEL